MTMGDYGDALHKISMAFLEKETVSLSKDIMPIINEHCRYSFMDDEMYRRSLNNLVFDAIDLARYNGVMVMGAPRFDKGPDENTLCIVDVEYRRYK